MEIVVPTQATFDEALTESETAFARIADLVGMRVQPFKPAKDSRSFRDQNLQHLFRTVNA